MGEEEEEEEVFILHGCGWMPADPLGMIDSGPLPSPPTSGRCAWRKQMMSK